MNKIVEFKLEKSENQNIEVKGFVSILKIVYNVFDDCMYLNVLVDLESDIAVVLKIHIVGRDRKVNSDSIYIDSVLTTKTGSLWHIFYKCVTLNKDVKLVITKKLRNIGRRY